MCRRKYGFLRVKTAVSQMNRGRRYHSRVALRCQYSALKPFENLSAPASVHPQRTWKAEFFVASYACLAHQRGSISPDARASSYIGVPGYAVETKNMQRLGRMR